MHKEVVVKKLFYFIIILIFGACSVTTEETATSSTTMPDYETTTLSGTMAGTAWTFYKGRVTVPTSSSGKYYYNMTSDNISNACSSTYTGTSSNPYILAGRDDAPAVGEEELCFSSGCSKTVTFYDGTAVHGEILSVDPLYIYIIPTGLSLPEEILVEYIAKLQFDDGFILVEDGYARYLYKNKILKKNNNLKSDFRTDYISENPSKKTPNDHIPGFRPIIKIPDDYWTNRQNLIKKQTPTEPKTLPQQPIIKKTEPTLLINEILTPPPPDNPSFIAVVDFGGNNVTEGDCRALTDRLRTELFNTKYYKVIEREMMEQIIKEQGFQQSGCSTDECMVEVGKLIGVEKIIGGSISQVGNVFSVSARIVNVETGEIETTGVYDHMGNIGELLTGGMKKVAYELIK